MGFRQLILSGQQLKSGNLPQILFCFLYICVPKPAAGDELTEGRKGNF